MGPPNNFINGCNGLSEDQIFFTAKMKLIHEHDIELASGEFKVLVNICQLLPAWANHTNTSTFSCYARTLLPCKYSLRYTSLDASSELSIMESESMSTRLQRLNLKTTTYFVFPSFFFISHLTYRISQYFRVHYILVNLVSKIHITKIEIAKINVCIHLYG